jgi:hypothetical protein
LCELDIVVAGGERAEDKVEMVKSVTAVVKVFIMNNNKGNGRVEADKCARARSRNGEDQRDEELGPYMLEISG